LRRALRRGRTGGAAIKGGVRISARGGDVYQSLRLSGIANAARLHVKVRATKLRGRDKPRLTAIVNESRRRR
jgi:hypothetical protein